MKRAFALLLVFSSALFALDKIPTYLDPPVDIYFTDWLLCGPFPNPLPEGIREYRFDETSLGFYRDYLLAAGGEGKIRPQEGMSVKHPDGSKKIWQRYHGYFGLIPLDEIFTPNVQTVAYAACEVQSSITRPVVLSITSNDGVRVWQNGQLILDHNIGGTEEPDRDLVPILLLQGENHFLVKIANGFGMWSFQFRFLDLAKTAYDLLPRAYLFSRPEIRETVDGWEIFVGQKYKVELLPEKVPARIEIVGPDARQVLAAFDTYLGETLVVKKADLPLAMGLYPALCRVIKADGEEHVLRSSIFIGVPPSMPKTCRQFRLTPVIGNELFVGREAAHNYECMRFQLASDSTAGNLEASDLWTQHEITEQYGRWITSLQHPKSPYELIFPAVQKVELLGAGSFEFRPNTTFQDLTDGLCQADLDRVSEMFKKKLGVDLQKAGEKSAIVVGLANKLPEDCQGISFPNDEAYLIKIGMSQMKVIGTSARGLHNALVTLRHLIEMGRPLPAATIFDYPANAHRCAFQYWPVPMNEEAKARILEYVDLKYNEICISTDAFRRLDDPKVAQAMKDYFDLLRRHQINPIPVVWLNGDKSWYEGVWLQDEPVDFAQDEVKLGFQRLVDLPNSRPMLHSERGGGIVYQRDTDYQIVSVEPPVIKRLVSGKISAAAKVYLDADIVDTRTHRFFKPCPSEEAAYQEFDKIIGQTIKLLNPTAIHVNHDEIGIMNSDSRCRKRRMKDHELAAYQINRMHDIIKSHDPQVDMIMWADAVNPYHNAGKKVLEQTCDLLHRDIIMAHWYYSAENFEQVDLIELGTKFFLDKGFRMYGCPWDHLVNHQLWEKVLQSHKGNPSCLGLLHTQWSGRNSGIAQTAEVNWKGYTWLSR